MNAINLIKSKWWIFALIVIFLLSYHIRSINIVEDRVLSFDPVYQYRYTYYFAEWGHVPIWDELTYYVGRSAGAAVAPPLMFYITTLIYFLFQSTGISLLTTSAYMSAIYGALIIIPAFLLGRELSNKYGGLISAFLIGTAPQILVRTFGPSYDTDQLVLFFLILTTYLGLYALRKRTVASVSLAIIGFVGFMMTWIFFLYPFVILSFFVLVYFLVNYFINAKGEKAKEIKAASLLKLRNHVIVLAVIFISLVLVGSVTGMNVFNNLFKLVGFAQAAETSIVNISIAELQEVSRINIPILEIFLVPIAIVFEVFFSLLFVTYLISKDIFKKKVLLPIIFILVFFSIFIATGILFGLDKYLVNISQDAAFGDYFWTYISSISIPIGRFLAGNHYLNLITLISLISSVILGIITTVRKNMRVAMFLMTLLPVSFYTLSRGVRFTEFTSALLLIMVAVGIGYLIKTGLEVKNPVFKSVTIGIGIYLILIGGSIATEYGQGLGPDMNANWDNAWTFIKNETPELSIVGTWWDPGHMIAGQGERRNFADGAHCPPERCFYPINTRITDLGRIMSTDNETLSLELIRKYQGTSPKVYWIASDDLIGKYRWLQYFGLGCDGTGQHTLNGHMKCPLYAQLGYQNFYQTPGGISIMDYGSVKVLMGDIPFPIYVEGRYMLLFEEYIFYDGQRLTTINLNNFNETEMMESVRRLEDELGFILSEQKVQYTLWVPGHRSYVVMIPPNLRNTVFTKMFMLEGEGLEHFKQVYKNDQIKIYEVV